MAIETYDVTSEQLEILMQNPAAEWKGHIQTALSILITSIINIMAIGFDMSNASLRINVGVGVLSLVGFSIALKFYFSAKRNSNNRLHKILSQPIQRLKADEQAL